jgi:3-carboxy-cis,cis-muconate cycloisomerase
MRGLFSDHALIQRYIDAEVALAKAEARVGVIPKEAADVIARESTIERIDFDHMREETDIVGYPILPLVHQLVEMCGDAGRYVHWGATTQDIMDTAVALQVRDALDVVDATFASCARSSPSSQSSIAIRRWRAAPILQQALPVTFGYKVAIWLAMFDRHQQRLAELRPRVAVVEFAGAAGTLASLGDKGFEVQKAMAEELNLGVPATTWHVARDGFAEAVNLLALVTGSLGKIALDIMIMASTEFAKSMSRSSRDAARAAPCRKSATRFQAN